MRRPDAKRSMRIGIITPSSNSVLEPLTSAMAATLEGRVTAHFSRLKVTAISDDPASHHQFDIPVMLKAAELLADADVDVIVWDGTSGSWEGLDQDLALVSAIEEHIRVPATSATIALVEAFRALNVRRYALLVPYVDSITQRIQANLGELGFECSVAINENITVNDGFASMSVATISDRCRRVAAASPEAIVIHCTNVRGAEIIEPLEAELGVPILDSVAVAFWGALERLGSPLTVGGFGRLLARPRSLTASRDA